MKFFCTDKPGPDSAPSDSGSSSLAVPIAVPVIALLILAVSLFFLCRSKWFKKLKGGIEIARALRKTSTSEPAAPKLEEAHPRQSRDPPPRPPPPQRRSNVSVSAESIELTEGESHPSMVEMGLPNRDCYHVGGCQSCRHPELFEISSSQGESSAEQQNVTVIEVHADPDLISLNISDDSVLLRTAESEELYTNSNHSLEMEESSLSWDNGDVLGSSTPLNRSSVQLLSPDSSTDSILGQEPATYSRKPVKPHRKAPPPPIFSPRGRARSTCGRLHEVGLSCSLCLGHDEEQARLARQGVESSPINLSTSTVPLATLVQLDELQSEEEFGALTFQREAAVMVENLDRIRTETLDRELQNGMTPPRTPSLSDWERDFGTGARSATIGPPVPNRHRLEFTAKEDSSEFLDKSSNKRQV